MESFWNLMICFCYFCKKKLFFILGEIKFLRGFTNFFSELLDCNKLLILIESLIIFHWKSAKKSKVIVVFEQNLGQIRSNVVKKKQRSWHFKGFFHNFHEVYRPMHSKARSCGSRNNWVEIKGKISYKQHIWRKLWQNCCIKNDKKLLF